MCQPGSVNEPCKRIVCKQHQRQQQQQQNLHDIGPDAIPKFSDGTLRIIKYHVIVIIMMIMVITMMTMA